jgi:hypothetical protein
LSLDEVQEFQRYVDLFYNEYVELVGRRGITNYFHMLGSGHVAEYLLACGNLYIHSQQGWEAFNSFVKVFYFRRTNRGGGRSSECNRTRQMARRFGRRLIWMSGFTYEEITETNKLILYMSTTNDEINNIIQYDEDDEDLREEESTVEAEYLNDYPELPIESEIMYEAEEDYEQIFTNEGDNCTCHENCKTIQAKYCVECNK